MTMTSTGPADQGFAILYVDDEEQALKYFRKGFNKEYPVLTAPGVPQALEILEKEHPRVGVLLTDHRMPGHTGVELLGRVRQAWPEIVRILVTAYSDVGSAVDAVNTGSVYKYLTKPVDPTHLGQVLREAMALFVERRRREDLFREKSNALQQLIVADRAKTVAAMASGLSQHLRGSLSAMSGYLEGLGATGEPLRIADEADASDLARRAVAETLSSSAAAAGGDAGLFVVEAPAAAVKVKADAGAAVRMLRNLLDHLARRAPAGGRVRVTVEGPVPYWNASAARLLVRGDGPGWAAWGDEEVASFFAPFAATASGAAASPGPGLGLLESFRVAQAHGGDLLTHGIAPLGPGFEVRLPLDPAAVRRPPLDAAGAVAKPFAA